MLLGIGALAALALWNRLRARAIGPAIVSHFGYYAVLPSLAIIGLVLNRK